MAEAKAPRQHHHVCVVELYDRVWNEAAFRKANPDRHQGCAAADEIERLVAAGAIAGDILPAEQSVAIMQTLDTIRAHIGLRYPGE